MSISSEVRRAGPYSGNGSTVAFAFAFKVFNTSQVVVTRTVSGVETVLTLTTHYTVALNSNQNTNPGGTVTMLSAPAVGQSITITSNVANLQPTAIANLGGFYPEVINDSLDRATIQIQQLDERLDRALVIPVSSSGISTQLPVPQSSKLIGWDSAGTALQNYNNIPVGSTVYQYVHRTIATAGQTAVALPITYTVGAMALSVFVNGLRVEQGSGLDYVETNNQTITFTSGLSAGDLVVVAIHGDIDAAATPPNYTIESIAALRLLTGTTTATQLLLLWNYVAGDGGGTFRYDSTDTTTVDNGGTVIVDAAGRRWKRQYRGPLHSKWFGARGDNATNDTAALQAALNAAANGALQIDAGTYIVDALLGRTNSEVFGEGVDVTILKRRSTLSSDDSIILWRDNKYYVKLHDLTLDWNSAPRPDVFLTSVTGALLCDNVEFYNLKILKPGGRVWGIGINTCKDVRIHDNYIFMPAGTTTNNNHAISLTSLSYVYGTQTRFWIENNYCQNCSIGAGDGGTLVIRGNVCLDWNYGGGISSGNNTLNRYNVIEGNTLISNFTGLDADGLTIKGIEYFGFYGHLANNTCAKCSGPGLFCIGRENTVVGNVCYDNNLYTPETLNGGIVIGFDGFDPAYNGSNNVVANNVCFDTQGASGTQQYGISVNPNNSGNVFIGNKLYDNKIGPFYTTKTEIFYGSNASGKTTTNLASISNGASATVTVTVTGAAVGDYVEGSCSVSLQGMSLTGYVSATNTVTLVVTNNTGSPIDLASATFNARASQPLPIS
jgi:hypothetical protein